MGRCVADLLLRGGVRCLESDAKMSSCRGPQPCIRATSRWQHRSPRRGWSMTHHGHPDSSFAGRCSSRLLLVAFDDCINKHRLSMPCAFLPLDLANSLCVPAAGLLLQRSAKDAWKSMGWKRTDPRLAEPRSALPSKLQYPAIGPRIDHRGPRLTTIPPVGMPVSGLPQDAGPGRVHPSEADLELRAAQQQPATA